MPQDQTAADSPPYGVESYIEDMLSELADMAAMRQHRALATLIHMAAIEAAVVARQVRREAGD